MTLRHTLQRACVALFGLMVACGGEVSGGPSNQNGGASEGAGLGVRFLGHAERCRALLHLVDGTGDDPVAAYKTVRGELALYGHGIADKPEVVAIAKADAIDPADLTKPRARLKRAAKREPLVLSSVSGRGVPDVLRAVATMIAESRQAEAEKVAPA